MDKADEREPTTGADIVPVKTSRLFHVRDDGARAFTICRGRTLRTPRSRHSSPRREHNKFRSLRVDASCGAGPATRVEGCSWRSTRRSVDQNVAMGPWNGYMAQESRVAGKKFRSTSS